MITRLLAAVASLLGTEVSCRIERPLLLEDTPHSWPAVDLLPNPRN